MTDIIPDAIPMPSRQQLRDRYLRDYGIWNPDAQISKDTQPHIDGLTIADQMLPLYALAITLFQSDDLDNKNSLQLEAVARGLQIPERLPPVGASGFLLCQASAAGGTIRQGDICRTEAGLRYECAQEALYLPGEPIPVVGIDTGDDTDQEPGTVLTWLQQRSGINAFATVDPEGLTGGRGAETNEELKDRIRYRLANPPASGNSAQYESFMETMVPLVAVQKAYTFPAIQGAGTTGVAFTLRRSTVGGSRVPNAAQRALVLSALTAPDAMPFSDSIFMTVLVESPLDVTLRVNWMREAAGWADLTPWPPTAGVLVVESTSPLVFVLNAGDYGRPVGKTIAFFDTVQRVFVRKRILAMEQVAGGFNWKITCANDNATSDLTFTPPVGAQCCPWSDSLASLVLPVLVHFDKLGPGEQVDFFRDFGGFRERRQPESPAYWPSLITTRLAEPIFDLPAIQDVIVDSPTLPFQTPVGERGVLANLLVLHELLAFPM